MARPAFLVFSENYFPYWQAQLNGAETKIYKTDYTLRSIYVPTGNHSLEMKFVSGPFRKGRIITILSLLVLGVLVCYEFVQRRSRKAARKPG